jgi:hypothetical protein
MTFSLMKGRQLTVGESGYDLFLMKGRQLTADESGYDLFPHEG